MAKGSIAKPKPDFSYTDANGATADLYWADVMSPAAGAEENTMRLEVHFGTGKSKYELNTNVPVSAIGEFRRGRETNIDMTRLPEPRDYNQIFPREIGVGATTDKTGKKLNVNLGGFLTFYDDPRHNDVYLTVRREDEEGVVLYDAQSMSGKPAISKKEASRMVNLVVAFNALSYAEAMYPKSAEIKIPHLKVGVFPD